MIYLDDEKRIFLEKKKLLLATSGGVDSMALLHLLHKEGYQVTAAHMNFNLRPEDCDKDQHLVEEFCKKNNIPFLSKTVDTQKFKKENKTSTQIAARQLRYQWFRSLIQTQHFDLLITAHHLDDAIETMLINMLRGSGLNGIKGIPELQENIYRPLLKFGKTEIIRYAEQFSVPWREDKSNQGNAYLRNALRNIVLKSLEEVQPNYRASFSRTLHFITEDYHLLESYIHATRKTLFAQVKEGEKVSIQSLLDLSVAETSIFHLFKPYGFFEPKEIIKLMKSGNSAEIQSDKFRLIKERDSLLIIRKKDEFQQPKNAITLDVNESIQQPFHWKLIRHTAPNSHFLANFDAEKITLPLILRKRKDGDFFYPTGMKGKKKLNKFFKDKKYNKIEKENAWILTTAKDEIIWVVGERLDRRFCPHNTTKICLSLKELK